LLKIVLKVLANAIRQDKDLAGGMAQVEECLPNQCKTLSSNANTAKKKKKE
jgi:hypothetical protein